MSQQAVVEEARTEDYRICKLKPNAETLGALIDFLARVKPFSEFRAGALVSAAKDQLLRQHHVCAMRGSTLIGYCGWILFTEEMGERWLRDQAPFEPVPDDRANAGALTIVCASDPKVVRRLIRATREANPGRRVFLRREYSEGRNPAKQTTVLNVAPQQATSPRVRAADARPRVRTRS